MASGVVNHAESILANDHHVNAGWEGKGSVSLVELVLVVSLSGIFRQAVPTIARMTPAVCFNPLASAS